MQVEDQGRADAAVAAAALVPHLIDVPPAMSIAAGRSAAAAVTADGAVYTWGSGALGRPGARNPPAPVQGLVATPVSKVCMGEYHGAAVTRAGGVAIWGRAVKELGEDDAASLDETAVPLQGWLGGRFATAIACGYQHTLVVGSEAPEIAAWPLPRAVNDTDSMGGLPSLDGEAADQAAPVRIQATVSPSSAAAPPQATAGDRISVDPDASKQDTAVSMLTTPPPDASTLATLQRPRTLWAAEECRAGPRPPWVADCAAMPEPTDVPALDRAWFGMFRPAHGEAVRVSTSRLRSSRRTQCTGLEACAVACIVWFFWQ